MVESASLYHNSLKSYKLQRLTGQKRKKKEKGISSHSSVLPPKCLLSCLSVCLFVFVLLSDFCLSVCLSTCLFVLCLSTEAAKTSCDYLFAHKAISIVFRCVLALHCAHSFACSRTLLRSFVRLLTHSREKKDDRKERRFKWR